MGCSTIFSHVKFSMIVKIALGILLASVIKFMLVVSIKTLFKVVFKIDVVEYLKSKLQS